MTSFRESASQSDYKPGISTTLLLFCVAMFLGSNAPWTSTRIVAQEKTEGIAAEAESSGKPATAAGNDVAEKKSSQPLDDRPRPLKEKGPFQDIKQPLKDFVKVKWKNGTLDFKTLASYEEVDSIVDAIRQSVGWGGGSSRGGNDGYRFDIQSEKIVGHLERKKESKQHVTTVLLEEIVKPHRTLTIRCSDDGSLRLSVSASQSAYLLRLNQQADGKLMVQELNGTQVFAGNAGNFDSFCRRHRDYSEKRLLPALEHFGLGGILTPYSPQIQRRVADLMIPWSQAEMEKANALTASLLSNSYSKREEATKQLEQNYKGNEALLTRVVFDRQFDPEIRARTRRVIRDKVDEAQVEQLDFIDQVASNMDAAYLMELIRSEADDTRRSQMAKRLREMAPDLVKDVTDNQSVVKLVLETSGRTRTEDISIDDDLPNVDPLKDKGQLQSVSEYTGQLVRLVWHKDQLKIDRENWKKPFGNQEISVLSAEVKKLLKRNNLPDEWYHDGGKYDAATAHHPQVIFENLEQQGRKGQSNANTVGAYYHYGGRHRNRSLSRTFNTGTLKGDLAFDKSARGPRAHRGRSSSTSIDGKPFILKLSELKDASRTINIEETKPGELRIMFSGEQSNYVVQLFLKKDQAVVQDVRGSKVIALEGKSFRDLQQKHPGYFTDSFFPLLRHVGINIDPQIEKRPNAKNSDSPKS